MSAIIKTLKTKTDETEQSVYPKTVLEAVVDAETNQTLDVILDNLSVGTQSGTAYVDFNEQSGEVTGEVEKVTSASLVDYDNSTSGVVGYNVQEAIDELSNGKVNISDIVDNLVSDRGDLPLSAKQGRELYTSVDYLNALIKRYYLDGGQTTLRMKLYTGNAAILYGYYLGNNGIDGTSIFALSLKRAYDNYGGNVVLTYFDGSECHLPVTPVDSEYIDIDFSSFSIYGWMHFTALYLW